MRLSWVCHWRDRQFLTISQCLSVCLSLLHTRAPAHHLHAFLLPRSNTQLWASVSLSARSGCHRLPLRQQMESPTSRRFALLDSGLHPQRSQGKWAGSNQGSRYPWGVRSGLQGVEGAPEMPVCLPGCWANWKFTELGTYVDFAGYMWLQSNVSKMIWPQKFITPAWFQIITVHMEWTSEF